jgi:hypothetical protein
MSNEPDRDRNNQGQFSDRIPPERVLEVFESRGDRARPLTASDVIDELGIARRTAHNKLNTLVERGALDTRKVGARGRVWWVPIPRDTESDAELPSPEDDPLFDLPTFSGEGPTDVSKNVDEYVAAGIAGESDDTDA